MSAVTERPVLLTSSPLSDDHYYGHSVKCQRIIEKHFRIIWQKELIQNPILGKDVQVVLGNPVDGTIKLAEEHLDWFPKLRIVFTLSNGHDFVDVNAFIRRGIRVCCTSGYTEPTAEFGFLLLLATARDLCNKIEEVREGVVVEGSLDKPAPGLTRATLGVIGLGRIGSLVAKAARCFSMRILYHNRRVRDPTLDKDAGAEFCSTLDELLRQSDYVIITCPLTPKTRLMIGAEQFKTMKKTAALVNIARAEVIDQEALVEALECGEIRGAALDVTSPGVLPTNHPLLQLPNVIVTNHCAYCTQSSLVTVVQQVVDNALNGLAGREMEDEVLLSTE